MLGTDALPNLAGGVRDARLELIDRMGQTGARLFGFALELPEAIDRLSVA